MYETRLGLSFLSSFQSAKVPIYACPNQNICSQHVIDWSPIQVYPKILRLVSRVNAKIFVGNGLHKNEEWIEIRCNVSPPHRTEANPHHHASPSLTYLPTTTTVHQKHLPLLCETPILPPLAPPHRPKFHPRAPHRPDLQRPSARAPHTSNPGARNSREESKRRRRRVQKAQRRHRMASRHRSRARPELRSLPRDITTRD